jgi:ferredoxin
MNQKKICIYYFSGTGNTKIVSQLFCEDFIRNGAIAQKIAIEDVLNKKISLKIKNYDILGFGHPVHAFGPPKIFSEFIEKLPAIENINTFYFRTAGDPICNGGSTTLVRKRLNRKGYKVFNESLIVMPANVLFKYDDELIKQLYDFACKKSRLIVNQILNNQLNLQKNNLLVKIISYFFNKLENMGVGYFGKYLYVTESCNHCDLCINRCPKRNIINDNGKIVFGKLCTFCMRCIYLCPYKAIKNKFMNLFILKDGFDIKKVINNPMLTGIYVTENTKGFFKRFFKYLNK